MPTSLISRITRKGLRTARNIRLELERRVHRKRGRRVALTDVRNLVLFVGNPRCGTTLVRTILDAHPRALMGNEVNIVQRLEAGDDWESVVGRIADSAERFRRRPVWQGYDYRAASTGMTCETTHPTILGDKKAGATTRLFGGDITLLDELERWSPAEVRVLHCVRNPYDVIATKTRRNGLPLQWNIHQYFEFERTASYVVDRLGPKRATRVYLEELIRSPRRTLAALGAFLELDVPASYLDRCEPMVHASPNPSRRLQPWPGDRRAEVSRLAATCEHLSPYMVRGRLEFAEIEVGAFSEAAHSAY